MQSVSLNEFIRIFGKARKKRLREENQRKHKERRAPGWDYALPAGVISITEAAKRLGICRNEAFSWLGENGWIHLNPDTKTWATRETAVERGWLAVRRKTIGRGVYVYQVVVTPDGLSELVRLGTVGIAVSGGR